MTTESRLLIAAAIAVALLALVLHLRAHVRTPAVVADSVRTRAC
jgi:hypothetical protein